MKFYPIIRTRTGHPRGFDFQDWASPKSLDFRLRLLVQQAMNEDYLPPITRARRVYWKTKEFVFWGLALHNEMFATAETVERLEESWRLSGDEKSQIERQTAHFKRVSGFWGGLVELTPNVYWEELAPFVAASLTKGLKSCAMASSSFGGFYGKSNFPFAARLFQYFVEPYWNQTSALVEPNAHNWTKGALHTRDKYELTCFASNEIAPPRLRTVPFDFENKRRTLFVRAIGEESEERALQTAIFSGCETCVVGPVELESHAKQIAQDVPETRVVWTKGIDKTVEAPDPHVAETKPGKQDFEKKNNNGTKQGSSQGNELRRPCFDKLEPYWELVRQIYGNVANRIGVVRIPNVFSNKVKQPTNDSKFKQRQTLNQKIERHNRRNSIDNDYKPLFLTGVNKETGRKKESKSLLPDSQDE